CAGPERLPSLGLLPGGWTRQTGLRVPGTLLHPLRRSRSPTPTPTAVEIKSRGCCGRERGGRGNGSQREVAGPAPLKSLSPGCLRPHLSRPRSATRRTKAGRRAPCGHSARSPGPAGDRPSPRRAPGPAWPRTALYAPLCSGPVRPGAPPAAPHSIRSCGRTQQSRVQRRSSNRSGGLGQAGCVPAFSRKATPGPQGSWQGLPFPFFLRACIAGREAGPRAAQRCRSYRELGWAGHLHPCGGQDPAPEGLQAAPEELEAELAMFETTDPPRTGENLNRDFAGERITCFPEGSELLRHCELRRGSRPRGKLLLGSGVHCPVPGQRAGGLPRWAPGFELEWGSLAGHGGSSPRPRCL
ncbi:hypothetical protein MC885_018256, partial [Smutsia gigantea]